jgi:hypothetical protein
MGLFGLWEAFHPSNVVDPDAADTQALGLSGWICLRAPFALSIR